MCTNMVLSGNLAIQSHVLLCFEQPLSKPARCKDTSFESNNVEHEQRTEDGGSTG